MEEYTGSLQETLRRKILPQFKSGKEKWPLVPDMIEY
jgi:hypothetical protein